MNSLSNQQFCDFLSVVVAQDFTMTFYVSFLFSSLKYVYVKFLEPILPSPSHSWGGRCPSQAGVAPLPPQSGCPILVARTPLDPNIPPHTQAFGWRERALL